MANARRSIGDAMNLTPDKLAFIQGGAVLPPDPKPSADLEPTKPNTPNPSTEELKADSLVEDPKPKRTRPTVKSRTTAASDDELHMAPILAPLTTRLHPETADALRRACLEQRLRRRKPHTQQEIVELAVRRWLSENGFVEQS